jgi:hypothetical protein
LPLQSLAMHLKWLAEQWSLHTTGKNTILSLPPVKVTQLQVSKSLPVQQLSAWRVHCSPPCRYNFMPLARGTAACGYTALLSLFWAAGMPVTSSIPKDYQVGVVSPQQ